MQGRPTCSVIIAAYNAASTIEQTLASVRAQTLTDFEVVVVDDGSTDDTCARVSNHLGDPRVRLHRQQNTGPGPARNTGIALARGRYVCVLDSDDLWLPSYLERMVAALERAPQAGFAFTRAWILERATNRIWKAPTSINVPQQLPRDAESFILALLDVNFIFNSVTVRREVLETVGSYDPALSRSEDYELWLRIVGAGYLPVYDPGPLAVCSERSDSVSKDDLAMDLGIRDAYRKLISRRNLPARVIDRARLRLTEVEDAIELLEGQRRTPVRVLVRQMVAGATREWRRRRRRRSAPPPEVAAAFPGVGCGEHAGSDAIPTVDLAA